jgi:hypothetical protein
MFHSRPSPETARLKFLACMAAAGLLACLWLAVRMSGGTLPSHSAIVVGLVVLAAALMSVLLRLLARIAASRNQPDLSASELSPLTFPPESRLQRPHLQRAK